jgi:OmpA-OmpF porin, OOP family
MTKILFSLCILLGSIAIAQATEDVLPNQLQQIESLQRRAEKLAFDGLDSSDYHLAKARTWLNLALSEYYDKDSSGIISTAIGQAETLLVALEHKQTGISMDTPLQVPGSEAVRPDLLDKISTLKKHEKFSCAQRLLAEAEVYLVWTGHEKYESGWSHAESYARNVEDRIYAAQVAIDNCTAAPAVSLPPPPLEKITLSGDALFIFDKATLNSSELWRLDELAENIRKASVLEEVILVGHTDRLRSDGHPERNQILSEQRAESIRQYLIGKGIAADKIHASGAGSSQPLVQCSTKQSKEKQVECLQPNRRVEIVLRGAK